MIRRPKPGECGVPVVPGGTIFAQRCCRHECNRRQPRRCFEDSDCRASRSVSCLTDTARGPVHGNASLRNLRIATFNINGIRFRLPVLLTWLREVSPDIVCVQELKATDSAFPVAAINEAGYGAIWHGQSAWNGVAILARDADPIESRCGLPGDRSDRQSRYLEAAVSGLLVGCLYPAKRQSTTGPEV